MLLFRCFSPDNTELLLRIEHISSLRRGKSGKYYACQTNQVDYEITEHDFNALVKILGVRMD